MENINEIPTESDLPPKPPRRFSKKKIILIILLTVIFLGGSLGLAYQYYYVIKPAKILTAAFKKTLPLRSFESLLVSTQKNNHFQLNVNYHEEAEELSDISFSLDHIDGDLENRAGIAARFDKDDLYLVFDYSPRNEVFEPIHQHYPELLPTKTYQLIFPVMKGTHWLHAKIPQARSLIEELLKTPAIEREIASPVSGLEEQDSASLEQTIIIRGVDRRFMSEDKRFYKIVIGFKKEELLDYLNSLKQDGLGIDGFFVESAIRMVESVENWNYDVAEVFIDYQTGDLHEVLLDLSAVPTQTIKEILRDANKRYFFIKDLSEVFSKMFEKPLGTVKFININQAPEVSLPDEDRVELDAVYQAVVRENLLSLIEEMIDIEGF